MILRWFICHVFFSLLQGFQASLSLLQKAKERKPKERHAKEKEPYMDHIPRSHRPLTARGKVRELAFSILPQEKFLGKIQGHCVPTMRRKLQEATSPVTLAARSSQEHELSLLHLAPELRSSFWESSGAHRSKEVLGTAKNGQVPKFMPPELQKIKYVNMKSLWMVRNTGFVARHTWIEYWVYQFSSPSPGRLSTLSKDKLTYLLETASLLKDQTYMSGVFCLMVYLVHLSITNTQNLTLIVLMTIWYSTIWPDLCSPFSKNEC